MQLSIPTTIIRALTRGIKATAMSPRSPIALQRATLNALGGNLPLPSGIQQTKLALAGRPALQLTPKHSDNKKVILYLHGGVYCIGSPQSHRNLCSHLAAYADRSVIALDYRLAPEHVYPAAIDDVIAAYIELLAQGYSANNVVIAGDSAGGGLSLACLQQLRKQGIALPAAAFLISPWIDLRNTAASHQTLKDSDPVLSTEFLNLLRDYYLQGTSNSEVRVSPLLENMNDLCPILIQVGSDEILLDDSLSLVRSMQAAGGDVQIQQSQGLWHVFQITPSLFAEARVALGKAGEFVRQY